MIQPTPSQPQIPPGTPPVPEPPKTFGWLKWVLIVVVVVFISSGTTYFVLQSKQNQQTQVIPTPSPTETSVKESNPTVNWKTYTNTKYGYSFKYPESWIQSKTVTIPSFEEPLIGPVKKGVSVKVYEDTGNLSAEQFLDQIYYKDYPTDQQYLKETYMKNSSTTFKPVTLNNIAATEFELFQPTGSGGYAAWITKSKFGIFLISKPVEGGQEILDQILSTFQFTE